MTGRPDSPRIALGTLVLLLGIGACRSQEAPPLGPGIPVTPPADATAGLAAFSEVCAACHSSRDGFDLAFFGFPDSTIVRRAVFHVDSGTARDIAAHVRTLGAAGAARGARIFQPGGTLLASDVDFATRLFGADGWPADMTTDRLLALDPLEIAVAMPFPRWSVEADNLDWLPDRPLPEAILGYRAGAPRRALDRYYGAPSLENLVAAVTALRAAERDPADPSAPCARIGGEGPVADGTACFEIRRWTSTLAAQHMLRGGVTGRLHPSLHDTWWDVGNAARLGIRGEVVDNRVANWASWMLLGWVFEPGRHASVYTGNGLLQSGLPRHATFVALRSQVARPRGSEAPFADAANAARFAPPHWTYDATRFAYGHLLERLGSGAGPVGADLLAEARSHVQQAYTAAAPKVTAAQRAELARQRDQLLAALS